MTTILSVTLLIAAVLQSPASVSGADATIFEELSGDRAPSQNSVYAVEQDSNGRLWIGTLGGLHVYDGRTTEVVRSLSPGQDIEAVRVISLHQDEQGLLWVGGMHATLDVLDLEELTVTSYGDRLRKAIRPGDDGVDFLEGGRAFPSDDRYQTIVRLDDGRALVGTMNGELLAFDDPAAPRPTLTRVAEPCSHDAHINIIWHLARSADGGVWVCRKEHTDLYAADLAMRVDLPDDLADALEGATVRTVLVDADGTTWLGSDNVGLIRYGADGDVLVLDRTTGLAHDGVRGLHRDGDALWIGTYRGLHRLDLASLHRGEVELRVWNTSDGLPNGEFNGGAACVTSDGVIVFGGIDGLTWTRPETLYRNSVRPAAALVHHHGDGAVDDVPGVLVPSDSVVLPWRQPHLEFSLAALDYQQPDRNRTRYRIEGLGTGWTETRPGETIHFPRVPAGRYNLEYQAANNDGVWGPVSTVDIRCEAAPWATTAARAGYALAALAMVGWLVSLEYRRRRRKELLEQRLAQADKLQAVGQLAGGLAHDFNNYLQVIMRQAEIGGFDLEEQHPTHECLDEIRTARERARVLVQRILSLGRTSDACLETRDLGRTTGDVENMLRSLAGERVDLFLDLDPTPLPVRMDDKQIGHALTNLVVNARDALVGRGRIRVFVRERELDAAEAQPFDVRPGPYVEITVADDGPGIPPAIREKVFEPFFSTKDVGKGTGLGLSTVHNIARQHGGAATISASLDGGTLVSVYLPMTADRPDAAGPDDDAPWRSAPRGNDETILLADDDDQVRELMAAALERAGYRVHAAADGRHAVELMKEIGPIDAAVLDVMMPRLNGRQVYDVIRETSLDVPVIFSTGYSADHLAREGIDASLTTILRKPYEPRDLLLALRDALDRRPVRV